MNDKVSVLLIALLGGAAGVLGVGAITDATADAPVAASQQPVVVRVETPTAVAGGNTAGTVKLADVAGLCALGGTGSDPGGHASHGSGGGTRAAASVNSSGNSANTNTNALALNNQIGVEQQTVVVQYAENQAEADAEQGQGQEQANDQGQEQANEQDQGQEQDQANDQGQAQGQEAEAEQAQGQAEGQAQGQEQVPESTTTTTTNPE